MDKKFPRKIWGKLNVVMGKYASRKAEIVALGSFFLIFFEHGATNSAFASGMPQGKKIVQVTLENGAQCEGNFANGKQINGKAICTSLIRNGDRYEGNIVNGKASGRGVLTLPSGDRYEGKFADNKLLGRGELTLSNGERHECIDGKYSVEGGYVSLFGDRYQVNLINGKASGKGVVAYQNGDRYEGDFVNGKRTGKGVFIWADGSRYEGDFIDGKKSGNGIYTWKNGDRYEGGWVDGMGTGKGVFIWANGNRYEGDFIDGKRTGKGVFTWINGNRYEGDFIDDGNRTGKGVYAWTNGDRYEGDCIDGKKSGKGIYTWKNGERYEGDWVDDKRTGKGVYTWTNGNRYEGKFDDGKEMDGINRDKYGFITANVFQEKADRIYSYGSSLNTQLFRKLYSEHSDDKNFNQYVEAYLAIPGQNEDENLPFDLMDKILKRYPDNPKVIGALLKFPIPPSSVDYIADHIANFKQEEKILLMIATRKDAALPTLSKIATVTTNNLVLWTVACHQNVWSGMWSHKIGSYSNADYDSFCFYDHNNELGEQFNEHECRAACLRGPSCNNAGDYEYYKLEKNNLDNASRKGSDWLKLARENDKHLQEALGQQDKCLNSYGACESQCKHNTERLNYRKTALEFLKNL